MRRRQPHDAHISRRGDTGHSGYHVPDVRGRGSDAVSLAGLGLDPRTDLAPSNTVPDHRAPGADRGGRGIDPPRIARTRKLTTMMMIIAGLPLSTAAAAESAIFEN